MKHPSKKHKLAKKKPREKSPSDRLKVRRNRLKSVRQDIKDIKNRKKEKEKGATKSVIDRVPSADTLADLERMNREGW